MPRISDAKEKLTGAARELIWRNSYGATSVDDICAQADVRKGSFYHFFKSKAELELAAMDEHWKETRTHLDAIFSPSVPPLERLARYFDDAYATQVRLKAQFGSVLGCPLASVGSEVCMQDSEIREKASQILDLYVKYIVSAIRDAHAAGVIVAPDAEATAQVVFAYKQGVLLQARIANNAELLRDLKKGAFAILGAKLP